jgi:hypothetical protein
VLAKIGGLSLVNDDAGTPAYRLAGIVFKNPVLIARVAARLFRYLTSRNAPREIFQSLLRGQVHTLGVGMHNFMDAAQVAQAPMIQSSRRDWTLASSRRGEAEWRMAGGADVLHEPADVVRSLRRPVAGSGAVEAAAGLRARGSRAGVANSADAVGEAVSFPSL